MDRCPVLLAGGMNLDAALIIGYLALLFIAMLAPYLPKRKSQVDQLKSPLTSVPIFVGLAAATFLLVGRGGLIFPLAPVLLIPFVRRGAWTLLGGIVATCLFAPAVWWNANPISLPYWQWAFFAILSAAAVLAVSASLSANHAAKQPDAPSRFEFILAFGSAVIVALVLGAYSAAFTNDIPAHTAWHHWGAYLSPVEALLAGGLPFRDFPIQYGIGPTLLIASVCGADCWSGMFNAVLVANALYAGALVICALIVMSEHARILRVTAAIAVGFGALLWTAFPSDFGTALATPSVAGLRFFPLVCQLLLILWSEENPRIPTYLGHAVWAFNLFWSVEAAAFASLLWWPWLALRAVRQQSESGQYRIILRYAVTGVTAFFFVMALLLALFWLSFSALPELSTVIAYFQNPPGRWPANPFGPLWLAILIAVMAVGTIVRGKIVDGGALFACLITMTVVFSYYLSRSHDNNVLNLFPFMLLVAFCLLPHYAKQLNPEEAFRRGFCLTFIMSVIVFVAAFNFSVWNKVVDEGQLGYVGSAPLIRQVSVDGTDANPIISPDAIALLDEIRKKSDYAPLLFDEKAVMPWAPAGYGWTSVNNVANYSPLPPPLARRYIRRTATRYQRAGWIIVKQRNFGKWAELFAESYDIRTVKQRGQYSAYLMTPKRLATIP
jgi:hypothetical protein